MLQIAGWQRYNRYYSCSNNIVGYTETRRRHKPYNEFAFRDWLLGPGSEHGKGFGDMSTTVCPVLLCRLWTTRRYFMQLRNVVRKCVRYIFVKNLPGTSHALGFEEQDERPGINNTDIFQHNSSWSVVTVLVLDTQATHSQLPKALTNWLRILTGKVGRCVTHVILLCTWYAYFSSLLYLYQARCCAINSSSKGYQYGIQQARRRPLMLAL